MAQQAQYPYNDYYIYVVLHKGEGRRYANLVSIQYGKSVRKTISYARYLMSVKLGRFLTDDEHVDHIDNNKLNDDINNLQILSLADNNRKEASRHGVSMVRLKCPNCNKIFVKQKRQTHLKKPNAMNCTCCNRSCSAKFQMKLKDNYDLYKQQILTNVVEEYIEHQI